MRQNVAYGFERTTTAEEETNAFLMKLIKIGWFLHGYLSLLFNELSELMPFNVQQDNLANWMQKTFNVDYAWNVLEFHRIRVRAGIPQHLRVPFQVRLDYFHCLRSGENVLWHIYLISKVSSVIFPLVVNWTRWQRWERVYVKSSNVNEESNVIQLWYILRSASYIRNEYTKMRLRPVTGKFQLRQIGNCWRVSHVLFS